MACLISILPREIQDILYEIVQYNTVEISVNRVYIYSNRRDIEVSIKFYTPSKIKITGRILKDEMIKFLYSKHEVSVLMFKREDGKYKSSRMTYSSKVSQINFTNGSAEIPRDLFAVCIKKLHRIYDIWDLLKVGTEV